MSPLVAAMTIPVAYLSIVCVLRYALGRCPVWVHPLVAVPAVAAQGVLSGWGSALLMAGAGAGALVLGLFLVGRLLTGVAVLSIATAVAVSPQVLPFGLLAGILVAAVAGTVRTVQVAGLARVKDRRDATLLAMGVSPGGITRPQPSLLPKASDVEQVITTEEDAKRMRLFLPGYLLAGVAGQMVVLLLLS